MADSKKLFLDKELRCGGLFELAIEVCASTDNEPIKIYTDYIWSLENISGPFDPFSKDLKNIQIDIGNARHSGLLKLGGFEVPFMTCNVREPGGANWFNICFYTEAICHVFGEEYELDLGQPNVPKDLADFFTKALKDLYNIFPFKLATLGFEVSGQYYLQKLLKPLTSNWMYSPFYAGKKYYDVIANENKKLVKQVEEL